MITQPILCAVCRGHANSGHGYGFLGRPHIHSCADTRCINLLARVYDMPKTQLEAYERIAMLRAGKLAGEYLDSEEKYVFTEMSAAQWKHFCQVMIIGFQDEMRQLIENGEAPF